MPNPIDLQSVSSVVIDGRTYVHQPEPSPVRIVILQRGWVMIGRWSRNGDMCSLDGASVIRTWGTTKGIGELRSGPTPATKLDPCGHVEFHILTTVAVIDCESAAWSL